MGAVYRATDSSLGREIAIKVLPPEVASDPDRLERFRREARALAALNHPHIVTIYSVEQDGEIHFLTMELVVGKALDQLLSGKGLPLDRVRQVGSAITEALLAAHDKGIIHRDLKPANIVVTESGQTKVLDFGLAKVKDAASSTGDATHFATSIGVVVGTPAYMSPEQVSGLDVDHRTDIFSLGVLLYEMVTGARPFSGRSDAELASSILRDRPTPVGEMRSAVPSELASVIHRCLEKSALSRFSSMAEVRRALHSSEKPAGRADAAPSVAVLPFKNLSADADSEFFSDGLAEEILNVLSQIDGLRVAARSSSFSFKGQAASVNEIGAKLQVATVLDGSVRRAGNRVRVTVQLISTADGFQIWSERYDREMADIFDVQDEIAKAIAGKLKITLAGGASVRIVKQATANVEAYEAYLRGRALLLKRGMHVNAGVEQLKRAVELDPKFAAAWAGLADANTVHGYWGSGAPGEVMPKALTAARRAVALDPDSGEAHCALGGALLMWERDFAAADASFQRGIALSPNFTQGRIWRAVFSLQLIGGRFAEGVAVARQAFENDPLSAYSAALFAFILAVAGEHGEALKFGRLGAERDPDALLSHWGHGMAAHYAGEFAEAVTAWDRAADISDRAPFALACLATTYADWGKLTEARAVHAEILAARTRKFVAYGTLAQSASAIGDMDAAYEFAHLSCDEREPVSLVFARCLPDWQRMRDDPRFITVWRRLGLPGWP